MELHEVTNKLVSKFGNRVRFAEVDRDFIEFVLANHRYNSSRFSDWHVIEVVRDDFKETNGSKWLTAILKGKVRNDAGEMVDA